MNIKQIMPKSLVTISKDSSIRDAALKMKENNVSSVLIMDGDKIIGIITERDITRAVADGKSCSEPAIDLATKNIIRIDSSKDIYEALDLMSLNKVRHLVVRECNKDIGVVSMRDVMNTITLLMAEESSY
ncbi:CBS domain-containing protein [Acidianus brierleyi]|uniref:Signal transduction protein n=1 Tax=Acidianus brierleyi TaxID=41673 RepID=A0A2U9IIJ1_9CREN|nr:CBS domain-containing protein [Acidianus brierleyi]AWR95795.1 CBS domain-containing protein [Acidianus brierleyi]